MSSQGSLTTSNNLTASSSGNETPFLLKKSQSSMISSKSKASIKDFDIQSELGKGSFGKVYLAKNKITKQYCAIKALDKNYMNRLNKAHEALAEREVLRQCDHPNIIKLYFTFQSSLKLFYVLEYCNNGNLKEFLDKNGQLPFKLAQFYTAEIVNVLKYFEEKNLVHRDIKPGNLMLDENNHLKFIDFGTATIIGCRYDIKQRMFVKTDSCNKEKELVGTSEYASPEMLNHTVENEKSCDLWALGCILYQFFHERTPFKGFNEKETIENIKKGGYSIREDIDPLALDLIKKLLSMNIDQRIGMNKIDELMSHPFFNGINFNYLHKAYVPKIQKSKSVFCLNKGTEGKDKKDIENNSDNESLYHEDNTTYLMNTSSYFKDHISDNTITSSISTVISSPRNTHLDEEGGCNTLTNTDCVKNELFY